MHDKSPISSSPCMKSWLLIAAQCSFTIVVILLLVLMLFTSVWTPIVRARLPQFRICVCVCV